MGGKGLEFIRLSEEHMAELWPLQRAYKAEIGEECPAEADLASLTRAIQSGRILFFGCREEGRLVACCSVSPTFSTFNYQTSGVFEDFFILPAYRHRGIARRLVQFAWQESGVSSLTVGCADCDEEMYKALGFRLRLGNLYAYEA